MKPSAVILLVLFVSVTWALRAHDGFLALVLATAGLYAILAKLARLAFRPPQPRPIDDPRRGFEVLPTGRGTPRDDYREEDQQRS